MTDKHHQVLVLAPLGVGSLEEDLRSGIGLDGKLSNLDLISQKELDSGNILEIFVSGQTWSSPNNRYVNNYSVKGPLCSMVSSSALVVKSRNLEQP